MQAAWPRFRDPELLPFLCEELFASSFAVARGLVGPSFAVQRLELTYPAPTYHDDYAAFFGCELRFGADHNRAVIDTRWLSHPLASHNPLTATHAVKDGKRALLYMEAIVRWLTKEMPDADLARQWVDRIRVVDSTHAYVHMLQAAVSRGAGDYKRERVIFRRRP